MNFNEQIPEWNNAGTEPSSSLKSTGFQGGYKPPAGVFNWFWSRIIAVVTEIRSNLSNVDNTADLDKPISNATQTALTELRDAMADNSSVSLHTSDKDNPHEVTKAQVGLGNVDNTSDADKPISTATQAALDKKVDKVSGKSLSTNDYTTAEKEKLAGIEEGATNYSHPTGDGNLHVPATGTTNSGKVLKAGATAGSASWGSLTKSDVGLGNVDNTSDANKPISTATQTALDKKQNTITGAATTITGSNLTASRALVSDSSGKVAVSDITATELSYLDGVTSNIQTQLNNNSSPFTSGSYGNSIKGNNGVVSNSYTFAVNNGSALGQGSTAIGFGTSATAYQFSTGVYNASSSGTVSLSGTTGSVFVVGTGKSYSETSNGFRVGKDSTCYGAAAFKSSGADYAEYNEWIDGNPNEEDRRGLFVTYEGEKIRLANAQDDYVLGVISAAPTVVGNTQSEDWQGRWLKDIFGERIKEPVEIEEAIDENGEVIPAHTELRFVTNPDYDPNAEYISREYRKEWAAVGLVGKLVVIDDGTCQVNGYCKPADGGIATAAESGYRVLSRIDDTHVKVFIK